MLVMLRIARGGVDHGCSDWLRAPRWGRSRLREVGRGQASPGVGLVRQSEAATLDQGDASGFRTAWP